MSLKAEPTDFAGMPSSTCVLINPINNPSKLSWLTLGYQLRNRINVEFGSKPISHQSVTFCHVSVDECSPAEQSIVRGVVTDH
jgi:hypothetical protein